MEFDNEECYNYVTINETDNPVIPSSDVTIILMMEGSTRFKNDPFILSLSKKTIIQYNKGYRNCVKDEEISSTTSDITHSYYTAFYCILLHCIMLCCIILYYTILYYTIPYYAAIYNIIQ